MSSAEPPRDADEADLEAAREAARRDFAREQAEAEAEAGRRGGGRRRKAEATASGDAPAATGMQRGYARGRARDEAIRAQLTPLGPDERPLGLLLAIGVVLLICGANAVLGAADGDYGYAALFVVGGSALAAGLWARIYVVIVVVEALLALAIIFATLSLILASSWLQVVGAVVVVALCSPVFWLLIRIMARLQVPRQ